MPANPEVVEYIRQRALALGADPETALKVSRAEALNVFDPAKPDLGGDEGSSFGPFQLHYSGMSKSMPNPGLGDEFTKATGLHASDPSTWKQQVDFALGKAVEGGWSPWMGAKAAGVGRWDGLPRGGITMGAAAGPSGPVAPGTVMPPLATAPGIPAAAPATAGLTLGDKVGSAIFGDETAAALKNVFGPNAPANSTGKQGLGLLGSALGGGNSEERAAFNRDMATIQPSSITMDDSAQRMQAGTQLMASLMNTRRKKPVGISMGV